MVLKAFGERVEENHIYQLVKPNSIVKTRTVCRGCNICYQVCFFLRKEEFNVKGKFETFKPKLIFPLYLH